MVLKRATRAFCSTCILLTANSTELSLVSTRRWPFERLPRHTCQKSSPDAGATAMRVHRSLPSRQHSSSKASVTICRDVPYDVKPRTVMDIYIPSQSPASPEADHKAKQQATQHPRETATLHGLGTVHSAEFSKQLPVALFCHGGVWATGV